jgi:hypothetical protein
MAAISRKRIEKLRRNSLPGEAMDEIPWGEKEVGGC